MQSQRPVSVTFSLYTKKRSAGLTATQLSAIEDGERQHCTPYRLKLLAVSSHHPVVLDV